MDLKELKLIGQNGLGINGVMHCILKIKENKNVLKLKIFQILLEEKQDLFGKELMNGL
jgi:hypothetical protein